MQESRSVFEFLTYRIAHVHFALNAQAISILKQHGGISLGQWRILAVIGSGAATVRDCVLNSGLDPSVVSRAVTSLERRKLIVSSRSDRDRRVIRVGLTEAGKQLHQRLLAQMRSRQQTLMETLRTEELEIFLQVLGKLEQVAAKGDSPG